MKFKRHTRIWILLAAVLAFCAPLRAADTTGTANAAAGESTLAQQGIQKALAGQFRLALDTLKRAQKLSPDDKQVSAALRLLDRYEADRLAFEQQRRREYGYEVQRVQWAMLVQDQLSSLEKTKHFDAARDLIQKDFFDAYQDIGTADLLEDTTPEEAAAMRTTSIEAAKKAVEILREADAKFNGKNGEYAKLYRKLTTTLVGTLESAGKVWTGVDTATTKGRWLGARNLQPVEEAMTDAATDLEVMVSKEPWRMALVHARLAQQITLDDDGMRRDAWYKSLLADAAERGKTAIADARWHDALAIYASLEELEPDNDFFREQLATVRRHVRVLRLYGSPETEADDESDNVESDATTWEDVVRGADAEMVRRAISEVGKSYVSPVKYEDLAAGAIESIIVLAETPQVAGTFEGLKDKTKTKAFVDSLRERLDSLRHKDRIDHMDVQLALNYVLSQSEQTVRIPLEVLAVEFADGMLGKLDRFSAMIWPFDVTAFEKSTMGSFKGIGVQITKEPGKPLRVISPLLDTPAYKAGLKAGDLIMKVDGTETAKHSTDKLIEMIMGPEGTAVTLTIKRRGVADPFDVDITRATVEIATIKGWRRHDSGQWGYALKSDGIGYIRMTQFTGTTHEDLHKALQSLGKDVDSVILDLRSNPGGLLRSATGIANEFLGGGNRIVATRGRQSRTREFTSNNQGSYLKGNLVVLIDEHSASAAEILSGALKDLKRSITIGQRSYGKGSVQNVISVRGQQAFLKLTTAYYYLPMGRLLHRKDHAKDWGVNPDIEVTMTPRQVRRWLDVRRKTELLAETEADIHAADLERQYDYDLQLKTAVLILELQKLQARMSKPAQYAAETVSNQPS